MAATMEKQKKEGQRRMDLLVAQFGINPNLSKYLKQGKLYYSYLTCNGLVGSVDTISYNPEYESAVEEFERTTDSYVYHCIEQSNTLIMLYVSKYEEEWDSDLSFEKTSRGVLLYTFANVYTPDEDFGEIGEVAISAIKDITEKFVLIRLG